MVKIVGSASYIYRNQEKFECVKQIVSNIFLNLYGLLPENHSLYKAKVFFSDGRVVDAEVLRDCVEIFYPTDPFDGRFNVWLKKNFYYQTQKSG